MAPVAGKPFLEWLLLWIDSWQIKNPKKFCYLLALAISL